MKAILIDPFNETVTEVEHNGNYRNIYTLLSHPEHPVSCFTVVDIGNGDSIFVDDEGLFKDPKHFFAWKGYEQPLAGKGLILGCDDEGESISPKITLDEVRANVKFVNDIRFKDFEHFEGTMDHPVLGEGTWVIGNRPIFEAMPIEKLSESEMEQILKAEVQTDNPYTLDDINDSKDIS